MEVTITNFYDVLKTLPDVFREAQFLSFDTEFTGLRLEGKNSYNYFDTLSELYDASKERIQSFLAIQFGLCAFKFHPDENRYTYRAYNFYVFPPTSKKNFACQVSCIRFLAGSGFDFNKLFNGGIPYLNQEELDVELEKLKFRQDKYGQAVESPAIRIPEENKTEIDSIIKKIGDFLDSSEKEITLPRKNSFIRRLIYQTSQEKFGSRVTLQTTKDETLNVFKGLSEEERQKKCDEKLQEEKDAVMKQVGFSNVIKLIIDSGKPLVGHNLLQDLLFTINQFLQPLPSNFIEFRQLVNDLFPRLVDTKHIASSIGEKKSAMESSLTNLMEGYDESEIPTVDAEEVRFGYIKGTERLHEAGYDAYLTGLSFLAMMGRVGKLNMTNIYKTLPDNPLLRPMMNKLSVPRLADISYMDLDGCYVAPKRNNVFHISFPDTWKRDDLLNYFKDYGFINIAWIDSTSAYIGVAKEYIKKIRKTLMKLPNQKCVIQPYQQFKNVLNKPEVRKEQEQTESGNSLDKARKRRSSEDIGEPVVPSVKKSCAFSVPAFE